MRKLLILIFILPFSLQSQQTSRKELEFNQNIQVIEAKASCGICMFDMDGFNCELAVNIGGAKYYVEGTDIDDYGDAHSDDGFCNAIRDVKIQGQIVNDKYIVTYFKLFQKSQRLFRK